MKTECRTSNQSPKDLQPPRLQTPVRITEQVWPEGTVPVVSIFCITYNHENFIRDAIEGFLMQETTFPVEIFVHDDASTDCTADIVREYQANYPRLFRTVFQKENQFTKSQFRFFFEYLSKQRGEFTAVCEGDDYWTYARKLQAQVDALQQHAECSMCFHNAYQEFVEAGRRQVFNTQFWGHRFELKDMFKYEFVIPTASMLFRKTWLRRTERLDQCFCGDRAIQLLLLNTGPAAFVNKAWSVYRIHGGGLTRMMETNVGSTIMANSIALYYGFNETTGGRHWGLIQKEIIRLVVERSAFQAGPLCNKESCYERDASIQQQTISPELCWESMETMVRDAVSYLKEPLVTAMRDPKYFTAAVTRALISAGDAYYRAKRYQKAGVFYLAATSSGDRRARLLGVLLEYGMAGRIIRTIMHRSSRMWRGVQEKFKPRARCKIGRDC
jgi:glycosyltransferase involved in cell wall biosynthesis